MKILFDITVYMLASSSIMIGYVWFKSLTHPQLNYDQMSETNEITEERHSSNENLVAA